jgi:hypothetical protein
VPAMLLPILREDQKQILRSTARVTVTAAGRREGKSETLCARAAACANRGAKYGILVPTFKNAKPLWRKLMRILRPVAHLLHVSKAEMHIRFPSGGEISFYTDVNADGILGEDFDEFAIDEAARVREETVYDIVMPTLADRDGRLFAYSTPKGRNWLWREYRNGQDGTPGVASFHRPTYANPMPSIRKLADEMRDRLGASSRTYRQEWLAEFLENSGSVFGDVRSCAMRPILTEPEPGDSYTAGIDWGRTHDHTVVAIYSHRHGGIVAYDRFTGFEEQTMLSRVGGFLRRWKVRTVVVEVNIAGWVAESLRRSGFGVVDFTTTNASKSVLVDMMTSKIAERTIKLPTDETLLSEFEAFDYERLPSGLLRYSAPAGFHDDIVIASCLAMWGADEVAPASEAFYRHTAEVFAA